MKTKNLIFVISFIFIIMIYSSENYAITNESETQNTIENTFMVEQCEENIEIQNENITNKIQLDENNLINVSNNEEIYFGATCIDTPSENEKILLSTKNMITLQGWAVSNDVNSKVKLFLDNNLISDNLPRNSRPDVDQLVSPNYGGTEKTPNAGFSININISNLKIGNHILKVQVESSLGQVLSCSQKNIIIAEETFKGLACIDFPINNSDVFNNTNTTIHVQGWAVSDDKNIKVKLFLDNNLILDNLPRNSRPDVDQLVSPDYGGTEKTPNAGFFGNIDVSNLPNGKHIIKIEEVSSNGKILYSADTLVNIKHDKKTGEICLDNPVNNSNIIIPTQSTISINGWAVSNCSKAILKMFLDNHEVKCNIERIDREDVNNIVSINYGGIINTPKAGFKCEMSLSGISVGNHILRVEQISNYGEFISKSEAQINVKGKKYKGLVCIDTPKNKENLVKQDILQINIIGWAVSEDENSQLKLFLDGKECNNNIIKTDRSDIDANIAPNYGGKATNSSTGFMTNINMNELSVGKHSIRIAKISRYNDYISYSDISITISNKKFNGEMCIDLPTHNQTYTKGENITISGWAVAEDKEASVEIYVDDVFNSNAQRYFRSDVEYFVEKYGYQTLTAGFGKMISSSNLSVGIHKIKMYEKSRYGDIIGGVEVPIVIRSITNVSNNVNVNNNTNNNNPSNIQNNTGQKVGGNQGIDVSQFQGDINWNKVSKTGIKYTMIRIGYRGYGNGALREDTKFKTNFVNACNSGLRVGVYFYSTAINVNEAENDAEYVVSILRKYGYQNSVSMPIALDLELISGVNTRDKNVSKNDRTNIAKAFCRKINSYGYTPMIYACTSFLNNNLNASQIPYDIWVAQYNSKCTYQGKYTMWQFSSTKKIDGITGNVDFNICYKNY